ncbi:MAG: hypothetical protein WCE63_07875 [Acidobacteriaceae bacterium]
MSVSEKDGQGAKRTANVCAPPPRFTVNRGDFTARADFDVEPFPKQGGSGQQEFRLLMNYVAHMVGQAAIGKRDVLPTIQQHDLRVFIHPSQTRRTGCAARDTSNDHYPFLRHVSPQTYSTSSSS